MKPPYVETADKVSAYLTRVGLPPEDQQLLGVFQTTWGMFESRLEICVWKLRGEEVAGKRPWTDKTTVSAWIEEWGAPRAGLPEDVAENLKIGSLAARDLMEYRHAIFHGWLVSFPGGSSFVRNPGWHGEQRRRPSNVAHVDGNLLRMAIDASWALSEAALWIYQSLDEDTINRVPETLEVSIRRARSYANELRHLTELVNHEKY